jgi:hypothetical protein
LRHAINDDRAGLEPVWVDAEGTAEPLELVDVVLAELPQAASATLESTAARRSEARRGRCGVAWGWFMGLSFS